jgi:tetratricopeptide (TPR) repeat protein
MNMIMIDRHQRRIRFRLPLYLFLFAVFFSLQLQCLSGQDMETYLAMIRDGRVSQVREILPDLLNRYPDHDGVFYLSAVVEMEGEAAVEKFQYLLEKFPVSDYADDASLRIGEYLYSRGLYSQASQHLKDLLIRYPSSEDRGRAADLMVKSFEATGELDSLEHYVKILDLRELLESGAAETAAASAVVVADAETLNPIVEDDDEETGPVITGRTESGSGSRSRSSVVVQAQKFKPWVIQIGAYADRDNAEHVKQRFENSGFDVSIIAVQDNGHILNAVQIVRFATRAEAEVAGRQISDEFGMLNRVFYRP